MNVSSLPIDIVRAIERNYPQGLTQRVKDQIMLLASHRLMVAVLDLSLQKDRSLSTLSTYVAAALWDFRDVLSWSEYIPSKASYLERLEDLGLSDPTPKI